MDAELQARLDRQRILAEGRNGSYSKLVFASTRGLSVRSPHRASRSIARRGAALTTNEKPRHTSLSSQDAEASLNVPAGLSSLTTRNTKLLKEVEKMKTSVSKDKIPGAKDLLRLLTETSKLLADNANMALQGKQLLQRQEQISEEAHKPLEFFTLRNVGDEKLKHAEPTPKRTRKRKDVAVNELQKPLTEQTDTMTMLQKEHTELHQQNDCLRVELSNMRKKFEQLTDKFRQATSFSSESRLRSALCDNSSSMDDLKQAINASEEILSEAKRAHAERKFRAKRAALEELEVAVEKGDEETLSAAIVAAQQADVDAVDLEKPEEKLQALRAMTQEEHAAKLLAWSLNMRPVLAAVRRRSNALAQESSYALSKKSVTCSTMHIE